MIPMEALDGRYVEGMHRRLVKSAAAAHMNMIRVWGGGIFPLDEFSSACDEEGVMVFADLMYAQVGPTDRRTDGQNACLTLAPRTDRRSGAPRHRGTGRRCHAMAGECA